MIDKMLIAEEIKKAVKKIGIEGRGSRVAIAEICGLNKATVSLWFNKNFPTQRPTLESLIKISLATGVSLDQLVYGDERPGKIPILEFQSFEEKNTDYLLAPWDTGREKDYFAVIMEDESMVSANEKTYPKGRIMIFDKNVDKNHLDSGVIVFAKIIDDQSFYVCRKIIKIGSELRLVALNPVYDAYFEWDNVEIKGILLFSIDCEANILHE